MLVDDINNALRETLWGAPVTDSKFSADFIDQIRKQTQNNAFANHIAATLNEQNK